MPDEGVTLGELGRRLDRLEEGVRSDLKAIDDRMATKLVSKDFYDGRHQAMIDRVAILERERAERSARWWALVITSTGAILAAVTDIVVHVAVHVH